VTETSDPLRAAIETAAAEDGIAFDGLSVECSGDVCSVEIPPEGFTQVGADAIDELLATYPAYADNWYHWHAEAPQAGDRWDFLRWLEGAEGRGVRARYGDLADGVTEPWGELAIRVSLDGDGGRTYSVCHVEDSGTDRGVADLDVHADPRAAREIARCDERGRYRPLKPAPTLPRGWRIAELDAHELIETVEAFYPATIANWHRERRDELDVTHWRETAGRQTGIYEVVSELPDEAVDWMAEACCVDSQCLKRRRWDRTADDHLDVPRGEGAFPCREPCSLVVAAARQWATLETEERRTYEFELSLSERNQLAALLDAVADGRVDDVREADVADGANRYRARYLRAKLRDLDGGLAE
jgi:hypothetical protein